MQQSIARMRHRFEEFDKHHLAQVFHSDRSTVVLLAEDDVDDRDTAIQSLKQSPKINDIYCVKNGEELMDYLQSRGAFERNVIPFYPTVILLDLNMPKMDGRQVLRQIKSDPLLKNIPVLVISGSDAPETMRDAYELGADAFLTKPFDLQKVEQIVAKNLW